jgi:thiamine biosynthesis lipoprotein
VIKFELKATGTTWFFEFDVDLSTLMEQRLFNDITNLLFQFQSKYSRFDYNSDVSLLNRGELLFNPTIDLIKLIDFGLKLEKETEGDFTIFIGQKMNYQGYTPNYNFEDGVKFEGQLIKGFDHYSPKSIQLKPEAKIDLGSYAKGYLVDLCYDLIVKSLGGIPFFINAGGDIRVNNYPQKFYLENPFVLNEYIGSIQINSGAIAASNNLKRTWTNSKNERFSHLESKNHVVGVFTYAQDCLTADAFSTLLFVSKPELSENIANVNSVSWLKVFDSHNYSKHPDYSGILF